MDNKDVMFSYEWYYDLMRNMINANGRGEDDDFLKYWIYPSSLIGQIDWGHFV